MTDKTETYRRALERELAGYERQGRKDRAQAVRAELARIGHPLKNDDQERDERVAQPEPPKEPRKGSRRSRSSSSSSRSS